MSEIAEQAPPANVCLACGSRSTEIHGRVLDCHACETTYYVPAAQLTQLDKAKALLRARRTRPAERYSLPPLGDVRVVLDERLDIAGYEPAPSVSGSAPVQGPGAEPVSSETQR